MRRHLIVLVPFLLVMPLGCRDAPEPVSAAAVAVPTPDPLSVLHDWDESRAQAWEEGDPTALAALYEPGSEAGAGDVALLRRYLARGVRVEGIRMQVLTARALVRRADRLQVEVVERFAGASVGGMPVPAGEPVRRLVDLRRHGGRWLVAEVRTSRPSAPR